MLKFEDLKEGETRLQEKKARAPRTKPRTATVLYLYPDFVNDSFDKGAVMLQVDATEGHKGSCTQLTWKQVAKHWVLADAPVVVEVHYSDDLEVQAFDLEQQVATLRQRITDLENCLTNTARERNFQQQRADSLEQRLGQMAAKPGRVAELGKLCDDFQQQFREASQHCTELRGQLSTVITERDQQIKRANYLDQRLDKQAQEMGELRRAALLTASAELAALATLEKARKTVQECATQLAAELTVAKRDRK